jgi:hypothetical protein
MAVNTLYTDGDNSQLRSVIFNATPQAIQQTKDIARQFKGGDELQTCRNIFDYLRNRITYRADGYHQQVKLPSALLRTREGDCKSYSVFTYAILTNLGIPCKYVLTSYNNDPTPSHIYVVTDSGIIIDAVWGKFNSEKKPNYKYYKKIDDMRISTITGIKSDNTEIQIGGNCNCEPKIGATAEQWYDANKGKIDLKAKDKALHIGASVPALAMRQLFQKFVESNAGGIATSIWNKIYLGMEQAGKTFTIPASELDALKNAVTSNAISKGVKIPTAAQRTQIDQLSSVKVSTPTNTGGAFPSGGVIVTTQNAQMSVADAWNKVMGANQYNLYKSYFTDVYNSQFAALQKKYTIQPTSQSDINNFNQFLKGWYRFGGNPDEFKGYVVRGKDNRPRGKTANYMLMIAKTRGLQAKDIGLIIRGFLDGFVGENFEWGGSGTYIFGAKNRGIGEPVTIATITAWLSAITGLLALLSKIWDFVESKIQRSKGQKELDQLTQDGWLIEQDYFSLPLPRPKTLEVKQIEMPTAEAPSLQDIGEMANFLSTTFPPKTNADANTPPTLQQLEEKNKSGALPPFVAAEVDNAKKDPNTLEALQKATTLTNKLVPTANNSVVTLYKVDYKNLDGKTAGFGGVILPVLIGVGVLLALNTKKN